MLRSTKSSSFLGHQKNLFLRALGWGSLQSKTDKTVQRDCRRGMPCQDHRGAHDMKERREQGDASGGLAVIRSEKKCDM